MKGKIFKSNTCERFVIDNGDGTITILQGKNLKPMKNAGMFIYNLGGVSSILDRLKEQQEITSEEYVIRCINRENVAEASRKMQKEKAAKARAESTVRNMQAYKDLLVSCTDGIIPATFENLSIVGQYILYTMGNDLPKMSVGYQIRKFYCEERNVVAIILDNPIMTDDDEMSAKFVVGAPGNYFLNYTRLYKLF